jgi:hypothetical protein
MCTLLVCPPPPPAWEAATGSLWTVYLWDSPDVWGCGCMCCQGCLWVHSLPACLPVTVQKCQLGVKTTACQLQCVTQCINAVEACYFLRYLCRGCPLEEAAHVPAYILLYLMLFLKLKALVGAGGGVPM